MILRGVQVESWRCLREPIALGPLGPGLNIVFGPNESGKSTLVDAICLGFYDRHNVKGSQILSRRPWGAVLGPTVEIEFEIGDDAYRLKKRFVESPSSELRKYQVAEQRWEKVARGRTADDMILSLVAGRVASRGLSKPEHWGIGQVLWTRQGEDRQLTVGTSQQAQLREALRISLNTARGEAIDAVIAQRYEQLYTSRGKLRARTEASLLEAELEQTADEEQRITEQLDLVGDAATELDEAEQQHELLEEELRSCSARLEKCNDQIEALAGAQNQFERLEASFARHKEQYERLKRQQKRIERTDAAAERVKSERLEAALAVEAAEKKVAAALADRDTHRSAARVAQQKLAEADQALSWLTCNRDLRQAEQEQQNNEQLAEAIEAAHGELMKLAAPTELEMHHLRRLDERRNVLQAELDASSLTVQVTPAEGANLVAAAIIDGGQPQDERIDTEPLTLKAASTLCLDIEGVGQITVKGGTSDAAALAADLVEIEHQWDRATAPFDHKTLTELVERAARRQVVEQQLADLRRQAEGAVAPAVLSRRISKLQARRTTLLQRGESLSFCWDSFERAVAQTEQDRETLAAGVDEAAASLDAAAEDLEAARQQLSDAKQELARAAATLRERQAEAKRLRAEDSLTDEQRDQQLGDARQATKTAEAELAGLEQSTVADLRNKRRELQQQRGELQQRLQQQQRLIGSLERDLEQAGGRGLYSQLAVASERREELQRRLARARLDSAAVQVLYKTVQQSKRGLFDALLRPVRERVVKGMRELIGSRYENIELGKTLMPDRLQVTGREEKATIEELSFGTQTQLMLLVRLALAGLLQQGGQNRQCVIVEDPLTSSDPQRQRAARDLLQSAADDTQLVVLTCQPGAYEGIEGAQYFDIAALASSDG